MTNFEFYKEDILKISAKYGSSIGVDKLSGIIDSCYHISCIDCKFFGENCHAKLMKWLYCEHIEKAALNEHELMLCKLFGDGLICRNEHGQLFIFKFEDNVVCDKSEVRKYKRSGCWSAMESEYSKKCYLINVGRFQNPNLKFEFIKWEDDEPWSIEELLKLNCEN